MSAEHLSIVTGASRGLGFALARQLLDAGHRVLCLSRSTPSGLGGERCEAWAIDLADAPAAAARLETWLQALEPGHFASSTLINNAAMLMPPGPVEEGDPATLSAALRVGLEAPVMLSAAFLRATRGWSGPRKLLQISSGLGRRAMAGSAAYCAVKAGLDHFSRGLALDEALRARGAKVVSLAPGVIDTDMQVQLRGADPARFVEQARFAQLKTDGHLDSPDAAAAKVLSYLARPDFGFQPVGDVRDA